jgi:alpha-beta hydrolase superfamily lysophospholipase
MNHIIWGSAKHVMRALLYGVIGGVVVAIVFLVLQLNSRPDLKVWHTAHMDEEFTADSGVESFSEYLALEGRLFEQLDNLVYDEIDPVDRTSIDRYNRGSLSDPTSWPKDWNRTFELTLESPRVGVLLIHGMSDSPYSMRSLGESLHEEGAWVVGLRVPGHGAAPSGLVHTEWQDMAAAVRLAVAHLRMKIGDRPFFIVGYSNGGALAVEHALAALEDPELHLPDRLVLLSPEIGISKLAALAVWQERLGHLLGLRKLAWQSILPEYDPYKYGSFALNASIQAYLITQEIKSHIAKLAAAGELERFPPTLAFQSVVDATVSAPALVTGLFDPLAGADHELVLFDINRVADVEALLKRNPTAWFEKTLLHTRTPYTISALTNESKEKRAVVIKQRQPNQGEITESKLGLRWPADVYSLAHVSLPFPPDDPVYGAASSKEDGRIHLGNLALRGERGVLRIGASDMLRLRWNPFHSYIEERVLEVLKDLGSSKER